MADNSDLVKLVKVPILIGFVVTIARIVLEFVGAPEIAVMIVGVAWLHLLFPIYFARRIVDLGFSKPFVALLKATLMWAVPVRLGVALTYVAGYVFQIDSGRFQPEALGPLGEGTTALQGFVIFPLTNFGSWMIGAVVLASVTGGLTLLFTRRTAAAT